MFTHAEQTKNCTCRLFLHKVTLQKESKAVTVLATLPHLPKSFFLNSLQNCLRPFFYFHSISLLLPIPLATQKGEKAFCSFYQLAAHVLFTHLHLFLSGFLAALSLFFNVSYFRYCFRRFRPLFLFSHALHMFKYERLLLTRDGGADKTFDAV